MYRKIILLNTVLLLAGAAGLSQTKPLTVKDLKTVTGCWEGTLTYLDYSTNKPFSMSADLNIERIGKTRSFSFANLYPKEPHANSIDTVSISPDGLLFDTKTLRSKQKLKDGSLEIITESQGEDGNDNRKAKFRFTYILGANLYHYKKEVCFDGTTEWILRHEYKYKRKSCDQK